MPSNQSVERFADNVWFKLLSRASMLLTAALIGLIAWFGTQMVGDIKSDVSGVKSDVSIIKDDIKPLGVLEARTVEALTTAKAAKAESEQNAKQLASLASRQDHDEVQDDRFQAAITKLAETVAALTSTVQVIYDDRQRATR